MTTKSSFSLIPVFALIVILAGPVSSQDASVRSSESRSHGDNGTSRWKHSSGVTNFNIESRGKIEVTDDDKDIKSLSGDGYLEITKTVFGSRRAIVIESLGGGKIKKEYYEGRSKMEWEPNGRVWLSEILPEIVRTTTLGAEGRVNRFFEKGGSRSVVSEMANLDGDYTRAHYAKLLLEKNIPSGELPNVITKIADLIDSDYYLATVFQQHVSKMLSTPEAANAFYLGTQKIESDYYKSVVLKEGLKKVSASPSQTKIILQSAAGIKSDYYLSVVLTALLEEDNMKAESLGELIQVSKKIPSDYYRSQVLSKALEKHDLSKAALKHVVEALGDLSSDYYKTGVLTRMADDSKIDSEVQIQMIALIEKTVSSAYYAAGALKSLLEHQDLSDESFKQLVSVGGKLNSDNYAAEVLKKAADDDLNKNKLTEILKAAANINSDHYLTEVLMSLADQVKSADTSVKDVYRQAAKKIDSESYYGKALKAID